MPLVRYELQNEYGLGKRELLQDVPKNNPDAMLDGVAVIGLVGIVRQLGSLAEFAADLFHELHDDIMATAARGHDLLVRVQQLEAELPYMETSLCLESNQLDFTHTAGARWHASNYIHQNNCSKGNFPPFIHNYYEDCRGPPNLHLLDKFDIGGPGACEKRYSDPSFFRMHWTNSELKRAKKAREGLKAMKVKKKAVGEHNRKVSNGITEPERSTRGLWYSSLSSDTRDNSDISAPSLNYEAKEKKMKSNKQFINNANMVSYGGNRQNVWPPRHMQTLRDFLAAEDDLTPFVLSADEIESQTDSGRSDGLEMVTKVGYHEKETGEEGSGSFDGFERVSKLAHCMKETCEQDTIRGSANKRGQEQAVEEVSIEESREQRADVISREADEVQSGENMSSEGDLFMDAMTTMESETESELRCRKEFISHLRDSPVDDTGKASIIHSSSNDGSSEEQHHHSEHKLQNRESLRCTEESNSTSPSYSKYLLEEKTISRNYQRKAQKRSWYPAILPTDVSELNREPPQPPYGQMVCRSQSNHNTRDVLVSYIQSDTEMFAEQHGETSEHRLQNMESLMCTEESNSTSRLFSNYCLHNEKDILTNYPHSAQKLSLPSAALLPKDISEPSTESPQTTSEQMKSHLDIHQNIAPLEQANNQAVKRTRIMTDHRQRTDECFANSTSDIKDEKEALSPSRLGKVVSELQPHSLVATLEKANHLPVNSVNFINASPRALSANSDIVQRPLHPLLTECAINSTHNNLRRNQEKTRDSKVAKTDHLRVTCEILPSCSGRQPFELLTDNQCLVEISLNVDDGSLVSPRPPKLSESSSSPASMLESPPRNAVANFDRGAPMDSLSPSFSSFASSPKSPIFSALDFPMSPVRIIWLPASRMIERPAISEMMRACSPTMEPKLFSSPSNPPPPPPPPISLLNSRSKLTRSCGITGKTSQAPPAPLPLIPVPPPPPPPLIPKCVKPVSQTQQKSRSIFRVQRNDDLIRSISMYDRSKLRKVTALKQSSKPKVMDEREILLQQIKTKSFRLRQANVEKNEGNKCPKPDSLNAAVILKKANAIRQAFAGSDEDDMSGEWMDNQD